MPSKLVRVLQGPNGRAEKIFRDKSWRDYPEGRVYITTKAEAVGDIREQVFVRSVGKCEKCGKYLTEESMEMNEKHPKGVGWATGSGGEVSLSNCEALCRNCHQGNPSSVHGNRRWHTAKLKESV